MRVRLLLLLCWLVLSAPVAAGFFFGTSAPAVVAGHEVALTPDLDRELLLEMGPYLPDLRKPVHAPIGIRLDVGKTSARSYAELGRRYAVIATRPGPEEAHLREVLVGHAVDSLVRGGLVAGVPVLVWLLLGERRRRELASPHPARLLAAGVGLGLVVMLLAAPWRAQQQPVEQRRWLPLAEVLPEVDLPAAAADVQIQSGLLTQGTRRLVASGFDTYDRSERFYRDLHERAQSLTGIRAAGPGERVAVLVSDRHDNVGMDPVVRTVADLAGARMVLDAGDDTSTGAAWERFSLDSLGEEFADYSDRVFVTGNHDHGDFVAERLDQLGWIGLRGEVTVIGGVRMLGVHDPRSSGLGTWRDETGLTFAEVESRVAETACAAQDSGQRVQLLLVHDANLGRSALARGCVDLVVGGHTHTRSGPTEVIGANGARGYRFTNGTTGGAAYAIAVGSKLRRPAEFSLLTFAKDGTPIGVQWVVVLTDGQIQPGEWVPIEASPTG